MNPLLTEQMLCLRMEKCGLAICLGPIKGLLVLRSMRVNFSCSEPVALRDHVRLEGGLCPELQQELGANQSWGQLQNQSSQVTKPLFLGSPTLVTVAMGTVMKMVAVVMKLMVASTPKNVTLVQVCACLFTSQPLHTLVRRPASGLARKVCVRRPLSGNADKRQKTIPKVLSCLQVTNKD